MHARRLSPKCGFSLVEVVVAVGIFAIAIISIIGLLVPINSSVADVRDSDDASRLSTVIQSEIQKLGYTAVAGFLTTPPTGNSRIFASRDTSKIFAGSDSRWVDGSGNATNADKFYLVELIRNDTLSPAANDTTAGFLAFTIKLTWPAYAGETAVNANSQSILLLPAAVTR